MGNFMKEKNPQTIQNRIFDNDIGDLGRFL